MTYPCAVVKAPDLPWEQTWLFAPQELTKRDMTDTCKNISKHGVVVDDHFRLIKYGELDFMGASPPIVMAPTALAKVYYTLVHLIVTLVQGDIALLNVGVPHARKRKQSNME